MQHPNNIQLQQERDFGQILSDSFQMLRQNYKEIFSGLIVFVGPLSAIGVTISLLSPISGYYISQAVSYLIQFLVFCYSYVYVKLYYEKGYSNFKSEDVWNAIKARYWADCLVMMVLIGVCFVLSIFLCFLPAFYIWVPLSFATMIRLHEDIDYIKAIEKSFSLNKDYWWRNAFVYFCEYFIVAAISIVFMLPFILLFVWYAMHNNVFGNIEGIEESSMFFKAYGILVAFSGILQILISPLWAYTAALIYFDLKEKKEGISLMNKIDEIGKTQESKYSNEGDF